MVINNYKNIDITVLDCTAGSGQMKLACDLTQKRVTSPGSPKGLPRFLAKFLIDAEHTSIFEHSSICFLASGISRSLLAQVTRQRHFSFTSASQHYQDYRDYPMSLRPDWDEDKVKAFHYREALQSSLNHYISLINAGEPPEEARQVLPNACTVNLMITANARALFEFLEARLCKRNTLEMQIFAEKLNRICYDWMPEIFHYSGPPCATGSCNQGSMSCKKS